MRGGDSFSQQQVSAGALRRLWYELTVTLQDIPKECFCHEHRHAYTIHTLIKVDQDTESLIIEWLRHQWCYPLANDALVI